MHRNQHSAIFMSKKTSNVDSRVFVLKRVHLCSPECPLDQAKAPVERQLSVSHQEEIHGLVTAATAEVVGCYMLFFNLKSGQ